MGGCFRTASGLWDRGSRTPWFAITVSLLFPMLSGSFSTAFLLVIVFALFLVSVASLRSLFGSDSGSVSEGGVHRKGNIALYDEDCRSLGSSVQQVSVLMLVEGDSW